MKSLGDNPGDFSILFKVLLAHARRKVEHRVIVPLVFCRACLYSRRYKGDKALINKVLLAVGPELYFPVEVVLVFGVAPHPGDGLIEFMLVRPDGTILKRPRFLGPVTGEEPRRFHVERPLEYITVQRNQSPRLVIRVPARPRRAAYHVFKLRNEVFPVPLRHYFFHFLFSCPPGSASAKEPAPIIIVNSRCGFLYFFQVKGPCLTPLGTYTADVLSIFNGCPSTMNSISPPSSS